MENKNINMNEEIVEVEYEVAEEETIVEETWKTKFGKGLKKHGKKVALGAAALAGMAISYWAGKKKMSDMAEEDFIFDNNDERIAMMEANSEEINEEMI